MTKGDKRFWRRAETLLLAGGIVMLFTYTTARLHREIASRHATQSFKDQLSRTSPTGRPNPGVSGQVDFSLWNPRRKQAYKDSLAAKTDSPVGILRIPKLRLEVAVFDGTDDLTLNRGVGRIIGTAKIGQTGNVGIAGHRDGFFRGLKDIKPGDEIELITHETVIHYVVERTEIVQPENVSVLQDTGAPALTLVTCFPFYFVGHAPQRFIVHALSTDFDGPNGPPNTQAGQINMKENLK